MLKNRIIVTLLHDGKGNVVKPVMFERPYRKVGRLTQYIRMCAKRDIDELILIDIEATPQQRTVDFEAIKDYTKELYCPVTIGGGIRTVDHVKSALNSGADKVVVDTRSIRAIDALQIVMKFGKQVLVGAVDYDGNHDYVLNCDLLNELFGEVIFTCKCSESMMVGYDIEVIARSREVIHIPIIVNGGCGSPGDMALALRAGADAVAAGSLFLYTDTTPSDCAKYLVSKGYNVRADYGKEPLLDWIKEPPKA